MKQLYKLLLGCGVLFLFAYQATAQEQDSTKGKSVQVVYQYDASGNRISREMQTIVLKAPPVNEDSTDTPETWVAQNTVNQVNGPLGNETTSEIYEQTLGESHVKVYPNPTKGVLKVDITNIPTDMNGKIIVYQMNGTIIKAKETIYASNIIDLSAQPNGVYFMKMFLRDKNKMWKIIKK